jgi:hypothetical protein
MDFQKFLTTVTGSGGVHAPGGATASGAYYWNDFI